MNPDSHNSHPAPLLVAKDVSVRFSLRGGKVLRAVDSVSLSLGRGEVLGLVGESGCGKSTFARAILNLVPASGSIRLGPQEMIGLGEPQLRPLRRKMQMVFQDPFSSLNPRMTVEAALREPLEVHALRPKDEISTRVEELLDLVGLPKAALRKYPHEFSGGQRQRIVIARALAMEPELLVADEPVSALDVSIQAQIINLLQDLVQRLGLSLLFIAHDLSVVRHISDRVAVMYLGRIVECGPAEQVISAPLHPYTQMLVAAVPRPEPGRRAENSVQPTKGTELPSPIDRPSGCAFHPRCPHARPECESRTPELRPMVGQEMACHIAPELRNS